ncbi:DsrE family protein [Kocuria oceani]|uniref:DsrE family protein n=1 Tax=Kocuria oceani TaxID=988827 RepID=UPI004035D014
MRKAPAMHRAVIHLNDAAPEKIQTVLHNTANLLAALGPEIQVEMVAHGPGIAVATTPAPEELTTELTGLLAAGVSLCACRNTMTARRLTPADIHPQAVVVASGVAHLVTRQTEGWSYLHP